MAFGDGELGAVEAVVLFWHFVQIDHKAVGQLADGHRDAARAEIVAALDHERRFFFAEQALQLALYRGVALLYLGAAGGKALYFMRLGGSGGAAAAVAPRAPAQQNNDIAGRGRLAPHVFFRHGAHHRADLHALGKVAGVIELIDNARGKADLVAVAGIARRRRGNKLALRQFAGHGIAHGHERISRAGNAHGLIDIAAVCQRIANGPSDARGRAAEWLDLCGVVVRLVFKQQQPRLLGAVVVHGDAHAAGVDLV